MPRYQVLVHGTNLLLTMPENPEQMAVGGVWVYRAIEAESEATALGAAVSDLLSDPAFEEEVWNTEAEKPEFEADEILPLDPDAPLDGSLNTACIFYIETEDQ